MQRVQFDDFDSDLYCPFCGHRTLAEMEQSPCEHTLYIAEDEGGLDYCSKRINKRALVKEADESGWDEATDQLECPDSLKFALYIGGSGLYVGYAAPSEE